MLKLVKNQANAKQNTEAELLFFFTFYIHVIIQKIVGHILKNKKKNKWVCIHKINHSENDDENEKYIAWA